MPSAPVRCTVTAAALTAAFTLSLSTQATADAGDNDIVRLRFTGVTVTDSAPRVIQPGNSWITYLSLYGSKNQVVGDAGTRCSAVEADKDRLTAQCERVVRLKGGTITLHDMITRTGSKPVTARTAIAGGTGLFNDAEGEGYLTLDNGRVHFDLYVDD